MFVLCCRLQKAWKGCFESVIRTEDINVHHGFEPVGAELANWRKEIASSSSTSKIVKMSSLADYSVIFWMADSHHVVNAAKLVHAFANSSF